MINPDKFNFMDAQKLATYSFDVIDVIQKMPEEFQVSSLSSVFVLMCQRYNMRPITLFEHVDKVMRNTSDKRYWSREFTAIQEYLEKELD